MFHQPVEKPLFTIQQMVRQVETAQPWAVRLQLLLFAEMLDQFIFGRPVQPIRSGKRIALPIVEHPFPFSHNHLPFGFQRSAIFLHQLEVNTLNIDGRDLRSADLAANPAPGMISRNALERVQRVGHARHPVQRRPVQ